MRPSYNVKFFPSWLAANGEDYYYNVLTGKDRINAYSTVPLIFRALNLRCNTLNKVPVYFYRARTEVEEYPLEESLPFKDLLWLAEAAVLISGASYFVKLKNGYDIKKGLQWLNPTTMQVKQEEDELLFWQEVDGKRFPDATRFWTEEEMLYWPMFNPGNDLGGGVSALSVATNNSDLQKNLTTFLDKFFQHGAMPVTMAMLPTGTTDLQVKEVEGRFRRILQGVRNAFRVVGVKGEVKFEKLTPELSTFEIDKLDAHSINNICWAFDIPKTLLTSDSANYATADTEYKNFISNTIIPRCRWYESKLNAFLKEYNYRVVFAPQELPEMKEDENKKATAFKTYIDGGMSKQLAAAIVGVDIPEDFEDFWNEEPPPVDQTVQEQLNQENQDLQKYYRKALTKLRSKNNAQCEFISEAIPETKRLKIFESLKDVKNDVELKKLFEGFKCLE